MSGKVALVTGGGRGIGRASSLRLAEAGARVIVADVLEAGAAETVTLIGKAGGAAEWSGLDVTRAAQVERLVQQTLDRHGRIDILHANAGIQGIPGSVATYSEHDFDAVMDVNVKGVFLLLRHVTPIMIEQRAGAVVVTCSIAALGAVPNLPAYVASKHAALGLVRSAACDLARFGVRVNAISPGAVMTPMIDEVLAAFRPHDPANTAALLAASSPMGRPIEPHEIADAVLYLCSDAARSITGANLVIDAGRAAFFHSVRSPGE